MIARPTIMATNFDSVLRPATAQSPAELMIRMRVMLLPHDPSDHARATGDVGPNSLAFDPRGIVDGKALDADGLLFDCQTWLDWEFNEFAIKFKKMVELSWNNQLILIPPEREGFVGDLSDAAYLDFVGKPDVPAHVVCKLDIQLLRDRMGRGRQATIDVVRLKPPTRLKPRPNPHFRSRALRISNEDLEWRDKGEGILQVTAAHEIGHWFGSPVPPSDPRRIFLHIDAPEDGTQLENPDDAYGKTLGRRMAIMGKGQLLTDYEARPWLERVRLHSGCLVGWEIVHRIHFARGRVPVSARQKRLTAARTRPSPATRTGAGTAP